MFLVFFELKVFSYKTLFICIYQACKFRHEKHELASQGNETVLQNSS